MKMFYSNANSNISMVGVLQSSKTQLRKWHKDPPSMLTTPPHVFGQSVTVPTPQLLVTGTTDCAVPASHPSASTDWTRPTLHQSSGSTDCSMPAPQTACGTSSSVLSTPIPVPIRAPAPQSSRASAISSVPVCVDDNSPVPARIITKSDVYVALEENLFRQK